jgi:hypothetical protein
MSALLGAFAGSLADRNLELDCRMRPGRGGRTPRANLLQSLASGRPESSSLLHP